MTVIVYVKWTSRINCQPLKHSRETSNVFSDVGLRSNSGSIRNGSVVSNGLRHSIATVRSDGGSTVSEKNNHETKAFFMKAKQVNYRQPSESFWDLYFGMNFF